MVNLCSFLLLQTSKMRFFSKNDTPRCDNEAHDVFRFEEFVALLRSCYGVCSADLFNRPYFCTAYPISDLHCQARLYARADDVNKTFGNNTEHREKKLLQTEIEIETLKNDGIKGYKGPRWTKGFKKAQVRSFKSPSESSLDFIPHNKSDKTIDLLLL